LVYTCNPSYSEGSQFKARPQEIVLKTLSQKNPSQKGLVEWLKVKALSSNPSTSKKKKKKKKKERKL
jgi:hypothetical protein